MQFPVLTLHISYIIQRVFTVRCMPPSPIPGHCCYPRTEWPLPGSYKTISCRELRAMNKNKKLLFEGSWPSLRFVFLSSCHALRPSAVRLHSHQHLANGNVCVCVCVSLNAWLLLWCCTCYGRVAYFWEFPGFFLVASLATNKFLWFVWISLVFRSRISYICCFFQVHKLLQYIITFLIFNAVKSAA